MDVLSPGPASGENSVFTSSVLLPSNVQQPEWEVASDGGRRGGGGEKGKTGDQRGKPARKDSE